MLSSFFLTLALLGQIDGPDKVAPYKLIHLKSKGDTMGQAVIWDIYPEEPADIEERNKELTFVAPPGEFKVKMRLIKGDVVQTFRKTIVIGEPAPPVPPVPPVPPTPLPDKFGLAKVAYQNAPQGSAKAKAPAIAKAYRDGLKAPGATGQDTLNTIGAATTAAIGSDAAEWATWRIAIRAALASLDAQKRLQPDQELYEALAEIATGIEAIR